MNEYVAPQEQVEQQDDLIRLLKMIIEKTDAMEGVIDAIMAKQKSLESLIENDILTPIRDGIEEENYAEFNNRYGAQLEPYREAAGIIEGNGYDLDREVYNASKDIPPERMDEYIEMVAAELGKQIGALKQRLGLATEDEVEIASDGENTEVSINGENVQAGAEQGEVPVGEVSEEDAKAVEEALAQDSDAIARQEHEKDKAREEERDKKRKEIYAKRR